MVKIKDRPEHGLGSWKMRRRFMWAITLFCMYCVYYVMRSGADTRVGETVVMSSFMCMFGILGSYVFGATWQDISMIKTRRNGGRDDCLDSSPSER